MESVASLSFDLSFACLRVPLREALSAENEAKAICTVSEVSV
jgi:hypothetical protein